MTRKRSHSDIEENPRTVSEGSFAPQNHTTTDTQQQKRELRPENPKPDRDCLPYGQVPALASVVADHVNAKRPVVLSHQTAGEKRLDCKEGEIATKRDDGEVVLKKVD